MKARFPNALSCTAEDGDILAFGRFKKPGSPALDKEPFLAFQRADDPFVVACLRNGARVRFFSPLWPRFDGQRATYLIQRIRQDRAPYIVTEEGRFFFDDEKLGMRHKSELPLDLKLEIIAN